MKGYGWGDNIVDSTWYIKDKLKDAWVALGALAAAAEGWAASAAASAATAAKNLESARATLAAAEAALAAAVNAGVVSATEAAAARALIAEVTKLIAVQAGKAASRATMRAISRGITRLFRLLGLVIVGYGVFQLLGYAGQKLSDLLFSWGKTNEKDIEVGRAEDAHQATDRLLAHAFADEFHAIQEAAGENAKYVSRLMEVPGNYSDDPAYRAGYEFVVSGMQLAINLYQFVALAAQEDKRYIKMGTEVIPSAAEAAAQATINFTAELEELASYELKLTLSGKDVEKILAEGELAGGLTLPKVEELAQVELTSISGLAPISPFNKQIVESWKDRAKFWTGSCHSVSLREHLALVATDLLELKTLDLVSLAEDALANSPATTSGRKSNIKRGQSRSSK